MACSQDEKRFVDASRVCGKLAGLIVRKIKGTPILYISHPLGFTNTYTPDHSSIISLRLVHLKPATVKVSVN